MIEDRLLDVACELCRRTGRRPREAFMRRAVSTAYYAVFHALARTCADELIRGGKRSGGAWSRVYRSIDHGSARRMLLTPAAVSIHPSIARIGSAFASLQEVRHEADYNPVFFEFYFDETNAHVELARRTIEDLDELNPEHRRALAALILFKPRGGA